MQVEWDQIVTYYLLYIIGGLLLLLTLMHMLYRRRSPISITAWLLFMLIAPYFFVLFYFFFGIRKRPLHQEKSPLPVYKDTAEQAPAHPIEALLRNIGIPPSSKGNSMSIYTDGIESYEALYDAFKQARHCICISTYVLKNDKVTRRLFDLLMEKSQAGVEVRILIDAFGSMGLYLWQFPLKKLRNGGIKVSFFMPLLRFPLHNRFNLRYHRKIYLVDNELLFSGGMNLGKEYMGPSPLRKRWIDILYRCEGPIVGSYLDVFESDWAYTQHILPKDTSALAFPVSGEYKLQIIPSGPDVISDSLLEAILFGIYKASKRIWILTPYFVPDEPILQALRIAHHRGVEIKLITPRKSDHIIANLGRISYIRELQEWGIEVALHEGPMLHAKAILFDEDALMLGSVNLDNRSFFLNYEVVTIVYSKEPIEQMQHWMQELLSNSTAHIPSDTKLRHMLENLMRVFAPQL